MSNRIRNWAKRALVAVLIAVTGCTTVPTTSEPSPQPDLPTSAQAGETTIVAIAAPEKKCCPPPSLLDFLGITQIVEGGSALIHRIGGRLRARLGMRFPGLEGRPPLVAITDPANLSDDASPAQQVAAKAKAEEDAAEQKVKALRYLATLGCGGCYPDIEEALLSALEDCTEMVRFEAVSAFRSTTTCPCKYCNADSCCSAAVQKALRKIAYEMNDNGCYVEPSPRVRRVARIALVQCDCFPITETAEDETDEERVPEEGPEPPPEQPADGEPANESPANESPATVSLPKPASTADKDIRLTSFTEQPQELPQYQPGSHQFAPEHELMATVNGQPIFMRDISARVKKRLASASNDQANQPGSPERGFVTTIVHEELERAIDDLLLFQHLPPEVTRLGTRPTNSALPQADVALFSIFRERKPQILAEFLRVDRRVDPRQIQWQYERDLQKYEQPVAVRWEQIKVRYGAAVSRESALQSIEYLRNRLLRVAAEPPRSFNTNAVESNSFNWTEFEGVKSRQIAQTLFNLPVGQPSPIIEDGKAWHLVRVLERRPARRVPLAEVADTIRDEIIAQRLLDEEKAYVARLRNQAIIWRP